MQSATPISLWSCIWRAGRYFALGVVVSWLVAAMHALARFNTPEPGRFVAETWSAFDERCRKHGHFNKFKSGDDLYLMPWSYRKGVQREMGVVAAELIFPRWRWLDGNRLHGGRSMIQEKFTPDSVSLATPSEKLLLDDRQVYESEEITLFCFGLNLDQRGYGWPLVSWDAFFHKPQSGPQKWQTQTLLGIDLPSPRWLLEMQPRRYRIRGQEKTTLPLVPRLEGVILSAVFYGAVGYALLAGRRGVRAWRRHRRGACVACGYILGAGVGAVCPECGRKSTGASLTREIL